MYYFRIFNSEIIPSIDKGEYGFSGLKQALAALSSLPGASPAASSALPEPVFAPEKLHRTCQRAKMGADKAAGCRRAGLASYRQVCRAPFHWGEADARQIRLPSRWRLCRLTDGAYPLRVERSPASILAAGRRVPPCQSMVKSPNRHFLLPPPLSKQGAIWYNIHIIRPRGFPRRQESEEYGR